MRLPISLLALTAAACDPASEISCGEGTRLEGDECVADVATDTGPTEADADTDTDTDADSDTDTDTDTDADTDRKIVGYFVEWGVYARDYQVEDIPAEQLTHINYAFVDISSAGECVVYDSWAALELDGGNFAKLRALKAQHPHLTVLMSIGGWTLSGYFPTVAASDASRQTFVASCVAFMVEHGFDGIDVDWEYPVSGGLYGGTPADTENYTLLMAEFRDQLDALGGDHPLTIAGPGGASNIANVQPAALAAELDWINVMTYDFAGAWDNVTGFNAPLYPASDDPLRDGSFSVDGSVQNWLDAGVPAEQIVVGLPLYGRGWGGVGATNDGLFQPASGASSQGTWEAGVFDYEDLIDNYVGAAGWTRGWHDEALVPWLYSADARVFISYDDDESIGHKTDYIVDRGLGGAMLWEIDADTDDHALIRQIHGALRD